MENTDIIKNYESEKVCDKLKKLASITAEADYDLTFRIHEGSAEKSTDCSHHMKGRSRHSLINLLAIGGLITAAIAAVVCFVHVFCSLVCGAR